MKHIITLVLTALLCSTNMFAHQNFLCKRSQEIRDRIQNARIAFFTSSMELTQKEAASFWPLYNQFHKECRMANKKIRENYNVLLTLNRQKDRSDLEVKKALQNYLDSFNRETEIHNLYLPEFYKILPPEKVMKMYIAEEEFRMKLINMLKNDFKDNGSDRKKQ